eukprot:5566936-Pleurochrysis_carterae.AAC.4
MARVAARAFQQLRPSSSKYGGAASVSLRRLATGPLGLTEAPPRRFSASMRLIASRLFICTNVT